MNGCACMTEIYGARFKREVLKYSAIDFRRSDSKNPNSESVQELEGRQDAFNLTEGATQG